VFRLGGGAVCWQSKKLKGVATSSTVAEYKAMTEGAKEAIWLRRLMRELGVGDDGPVLFRVDNESAIKLARNPVMHQKTKHVEIYWHFIREAVESGEVALEFVRTHLQDADFLTKALAGPQHRDACARIGLMRHGDAQMLQGAYGWDWIGWHGLDFEDD
jgi:hypothetical protein